MTFLPELTPEGDRVLLIKMVDLNPDMYNFAHEVRCFDMVTLAHLHKNGPDNGLVILLDLKGIVFGHFLKLSVVVMKKLLYYLQVKNIVRNQDLRN